MSKLDEYKKGTAPIPQKMLKWNFYGEGLESLKCEEVDVPEINANQLLVRQDAVGLCFSDTKVIALGQNHPRMAGRDLKTDPVTLGHEVSCTVVKVGENLKNRFKVGERFIIQADVFYKGVSMAYGYAISGGLAEYSVIPEEMIDGDAGCYLLPLWEGAGYVETALVEPWACVVSAYNQAHRSSIKAGGNLLVILGKQGDISDWSGAFEKGKEPGKVVCIGGECKLPDALAATLPSDWQEFKKVHTGDHGFDDIAVIGEVAPEIAEAASSVLANHSVMDFVGDHPFPRKLTLDIGRIHYNWHNYVGTNGNRVAEGYAEARTADLIEGGISWFIGAGGPMGQMHVQRAVLHPRPPKCILATDIDAERLQSVVDRFATAAKSRGVELIAINPNDFTSDAFNAKLLDITKGKGFNDIVSLVPVPALIEHAIGFLADEGWFNIFAGVARGTIAQLDVNAIKNRKVRYLGSSGSALTDMQQTLDKVHTGELSTNASLAAIAGMRAAREGIAGVKNGRFPGKSLVFPLIHDLPLLSLHDLKEKYPTVYAKLQDGKFWTKEAEEELLELLL